MIGQEEFVDYGVLHPGMSDLNPHAQRRRRSWSHHKKTLVKRETGANDWVGLDQDGTAQICAEMEVYGVIYDDFFNSKF